MEITEYIAIYAAIISTIVLIWDVKKYNSDRSKISITAGYRRAFHPDGTETPSPEFVIEIVNKGKRVANIIEIGFVRYSGKEVVVSIDRFKLSETESKSFPIENSFLQTNKDLNTVYCLDSRGQISKSKITNK
jgi:hypothetical protein